MSTQMISIARDFSPYPAGRYAADGPHSGQAFREQLLLPALAAARSEVVVELDGVLGYGSSFLEEAFGGLVRVGHLSVGSLKKHLKIRTSDPSYADEIWEYIENAGDALNVGNAR
ncbi:hypothetical protein HNQ50_000812 [Silvimonas terrae]|uniref:DUF4325 domain-containing protein n=1 Tax=Silvimonas terrae TaxID=300266 RepID=A0A840RCQ7_9NEIS|nr:STAS-like domain-containing protein [Silvimonas terrae]MBB5190102.1 hypothetical protein [Silvimonas terrae]